MHLIDLTNTSHTKANTGIQRVCKELYKELSKQKCIQTIIWDPYLLSWRKINKKENSLLMNKKLNLISSKRKPVWSIKQKITGYLKKIFKIKNFLYSENYNAIILPEIFSKNNFCNLNLLKNNYSGPKLAIFHDLIPLKFPSLSSPKTTAKFIDYLKALSEVDIVVPISDNSKNDLLLAWKKLNIKSIPIVKSISLGISNNNIKNNFNYSEKIKNILFVGSIEGRKNHIALLQAVEKLWTEGENFNLTLIGLCNHESGQEAKKLIRKLESKGRPIRWLGSVNEKILNIEYLKAYCTIYPSIYEGFGIPVIESLMRSIPCISSTGGALKETSQGGGCLIMNNEKTTTIGKNIKRLINDENLHRKLVKQALERKFKNWEEYTKEILDLINCFERSK